MLEDLIRRMLTKDHKKRADWNEVFTYEITDNGEMIDPKLKNSCSLKASTAVSSQSIKPPSLTREEQEENIRRIKRVESPNHNESTSGLKGEKFFNKPSMNLMPDTSLRDTFKSKSPYRGNGNVATNRYSKKDVHVKNHRKCI